jgi:Flp pilus assembly protein TadD
VEPERAPKRAEPRAPEIDARDARALTAEASRLYLKGSLGPAKDLFKKAIRKQPRHAPAHRGLGLVYQKLGRNANAIRSFKTYLKLAPNADDATVIRNRIERLGS